MLQPLTPFRNSILQLQQHRSDWSDCNLCPLCETRTKVVLFRYLNTYHRKLAKARASHQNSVNQERSPSLCDLCLIGEAPGESEDLVGKPFVGPAGNELNALIVSAFRQIKVCITDDPLERSVYTRPPPITILTNIISCYPTTDRDGRAPNEPEIKACRNRLIEFLNIMRPKLIVCIGQVAKRNLPYGFKTKTFVKHFPFVLDVIEIVHPSFILSRLNKFQRPTAEARVSLAIAELLRKHGYGVQS